LRHLIDAHEGIDFRHELGQVVAKPLRQAAGDDERLTAVVGLADLGGFENGIHALFLRRVDEGAGVDDDGVGGGGVVGDLDAALKERAEHNLGIDQVFGAAERDKPDAERCV
jgi:hypothetical protein